MRSVRKSRLLLALIAMLPLAWRTSPSNADVTFFIQREGSPGDNGLALFVQAAGTIREQDFEGPEFAPGVEVGDLSFNHTRFRLTRPQEAPLLPYIFSSEEFDAPGRFFGQGLVCGAGLRITTRRGRSPRGLGMWVFDDMRAFDSAYLIEVTENNGATWQAVLENQIAQSSRGHEIEGFVGAVSNRGIRSMTITSIDPASGTAQPDIFEIDHLLVAGVPPFHNTGDDGEGGDHECGDDGHHGRHGDNGSASSNGGERRCNRDGHHRRECRAGGRPSHSAYHRHR